MAKASTTTGINPAYAADLRTTYLQTFDSFAVDAGDIVDANDHINSRYARELLGTLTTAGLLTVTSEGDGNDAWQVANPGTYDDSTREQAVAVIDGWLVEHGIDAPKPEVKSTNRTNGGRAKGSFTADGNAINCLCGCGLQVQGKSLYKPGHDARHAGQVARNLAARAISDGKTKVDLDVIKAVGWDGIQSERLQDKAARIADGIVAKAIKKGTVEFVPVTGKVKIGRWEYDVETTPTTEAESGAVYIKKDGSRVPLTEEQYATVAWTPAA